MESGHGAKRSHADYPSTGVATATNASTPNAGGSARTAAAGGDDRRQSGLTGLGPDVRVGAARRIGGCGLVQVAVSTGCAVPKLPPDGYHFDAYVLPAF